MACAYYVIHLRMHGSRCTNSHVFCSVIVHSCISSKMSGGFTISSLAILFYRTHGDISKELERSFHLMGDYFGVINVESLHHWHPEKVITWSLASSKTQNFCAHVQRCRDFGGEVGTRTNSHQLFVIFVTMVIYERDTLRSATVGNWKPFKNDEKCFLLHLKTSFRSQYISNFVLTFWPCRKTAWLERQSYFQNLCHNLVNSNYNTNIAQYLKNESDNEIWSVNKIDHEKRFSWKIIHKMWWRNYS